MRTQSGESCNPATLEESVGPVALRPGLSLRLPNMSEILNQFQCCEHGYKVKLAIVSLIFRVMLLFVRLSGPGIGNATASRNSFADFVHNFVRCISFSREGCTAS